ncbi:hypothetical protein CRE_21227 [Caenorhabditis remanei]|uniref:Uncharacterized protein n=1 Tax=Caenorhabditis remanei TaxID=31234 RepID=E3MEY6_CAERE|nr:hypothetical protein CRE_21227 [Caenorhabditis remanei]
MTASSVLPPSYYVSDDDCIGEEEIGTVTDSEDVMDSEGQQQNCEESGDEISDEEVSDEEDEEDSEDEELEVEEGEKEEVEESNDSNDSESEDSEDSEVEDSEFGELLNEIREISSKLEALDAKSTPEIEIPRNEKKNKTSSKSNSQKEQKSSSPKQEEGLSSPMMIWLAIVFALGLLATYLPRNVYEMTRFRGYETNPVEFLVWKEEMNKEANLLYYATEIYEAKKKFEKMPFWEKLRTNRWTPLPSKFQGLQEYLNRFGFNGKATEEFMYRATPKFAESQKDEKEIRVSFELDDIDLPITLLNGEVQFKDGGELWITEMLRGYEVRRVYFITAEDLLAL